MKHSFFLQLVPRWWGPPSLTVLSHLPLDVPHPSSGMAPHKGTRLSLVVWAAGLLLALFSHEVPGVVSHRWLMWSIKSTEPQAFFFFHMVHWQWWVIHLPPCTQDLDQDLFSLFVWNRSRSLLNFMVCLLDCRDLFVFSVLITNIYCLLTMWWVLSEIRIMPSGSFYSNLRKRKEWLGDSNIVVEVITWVLKRQREVNALEPPSKGSKQRFKGSKA